MVKQFRNAQGYLSELGSQWAGELDIVFEEDVPKTYWETKGLSDGAMAFTLSMVVKNS